MSQNVLLEVMKVAREGLHALCQQDVYECNRRRICSIEAHTMKTTRVVSELDTNRYCV